MTSLLLESHVFISVDKTFYMKCHLLYYFWILLKHIPIQNFWWLLWLQDLSFSSFVVQLNTTWCCRHQPWSCSATDGVRSSHWTSRYGHWHWYTFTGQWCLHRVQDTHWTFLGKYLWLRKCCKLRGTVHVRYIPFLL